MSGSGRRDAENGAANKNERTYTVPVLHTPLSLPPVLAVAWVAAESGRAGEHLYSPPCVRVRVHVCVRVRVHVRVRVCEQASNFREGDLLHKQYFVHNSSTLTFKVEHILPHFGCEKRTLKVSITAIFYPSPSFGVERCRRRRRRLYH